MSRSSSPLFEEPSHMQDPYGGVDGIVVSEIQNQQEDLKRNNYGSMSKVSTSDVDIRTTAVANGDENTSLQGHRGKDLSPVRIRIIMISMCLGIFLAALDNTIVSTLMSHIASEFNAMPNISWIATGYLLSTSCFQPLYGKISDVLGRKPLLIFCNVVFGLGCLICGFSTNLWSLVLGRFVAGIGGGGLTSLASITTSDIVPLRDRALYQGICNLFFAAGTSCGGLVGGFFGEHGGGWRVAFLIQVPFCILSCLLITLYLELPPRHAHKDHNDRHSSQGLRTLDWQGGISLVVFLFLFMLTASLGGKEIPYKSKLFALACVITFVSGAVFVAIETYVAVDPILPVSFLKDRTICAGSLANFFCTMSMITTSFYLPVYWASVMNMGTTDVGKRSVPSFFSIAFGSLGAGYYMKRTGKYYWFLLGFCVFAVAGQVQINLVTPSVPVWQQYLLLVIPSFGVSVLLTVTLLAMIAAVPHEYQAATTSLSYAFRSTGCTLGVSVGAAIFRNSLSSFLDKKVLRLVSEEHTEAELRRIITKAAHSSEWIHKGAPLFVQSTLVECYHFACRATFKFCLVTLVLATISCALLREHKLHTSISRDN
ncbi:LANO_0C06612g1_1 [Lachancea nothofagi CBS 11611]|uniref:LANO_0C06612g1_1 n=1 Tax=Lachancea nothofagi CBS 11611 TaxID=1266666 RepID=A0A1G4J833_9SACH|nr:LANO_0C06612g1_1 [Lachancea nothofagi CBS 11611]